jgi:hypothetical protein
MVAEIITLKMLKEMKKLINYILVVCLAVMTFSSCETYKDNYKQEFSPIYPLCGEWTVDITDQTTSAVSHTYIYTYDTADKTATAMWLYINKAGYGTKCKLTCDAKAGTFSGSSAANALLGGTNTVTEGKVVVNGATTPSNGKSDAITMTYYSSLSGHTYTISGYRRTFFDEDE